MLRLAGEIADGVLLWACPADYVRDVVVPEVTAGRERASKPLDGFEILAAIPSAVSDDRAAVLDGVRTELHRLRRGHARGRRRGGARASRG